MPLIKSGQRPALFAANHGSCFLNKAFTLTTGYQDTLIAWSTKSFHPSMLTRKVHGTTGKEYTIVKRFAPSLVEAGLPLYPEYDDVERGILVPGRVFSLRTYTSDAKAGRVAMALQGDEGGSKGEEGAGGGSAGASTH